MFGYFRILVVCLFVSPKTNDQSNVLVRKYHIGYGNLYSTSTKKLLKNVVVAIILKLCHGMQYRKISIRVSTTEKAVSYVLQKILISRYVLQKTQYHVIYYRKTVSFASTIEKQYHLKVLQKKQYCGNYYSYSYNLPVAVLGFKSQCLHFSGSLLPCSKQTRTRQFTLFPHCHHCVQSQRAMFDVVATQIDTTHS